MTIKEEKSVVYLGSTDINTTIQMIEKDGWNAGELLYDDLKDFRRAVGNCLLYTSPSPRDLSTSRMPSSA